MANKTELIFILDKSGSMHGKEQDTIGGFNSFVEKTQKEEGQTLLTTILFSNSFKTIHDRVDIKDVKPLTDKEYYVGGCTALLDTIGYAITHTEELYKNMKEDAIPNHTMFVITTDGLENASQEYSYKLIKEMISTKQEKDNWEFLFLADNIDAAQTAEHMGIRRDRAANYSTERDTRAMFDSVHMMYCALSKEDRQEPVDLQKVLDKAKKNRDNNPDD